MGSESESKRENKDQTRRVWDCQFGLLPQTDPPKHLSTVGICQSHGGVWDSTKDVM